LITVLCRPLCWMYTLSCCYLTGNPAARLLRVRVTFPFPLQSVVLIDHMCLISCLRKPQSLNRKPPWRKAAFHLVSHQNYHNQLVSPSFRLISPNGSERSQLTVSTPFIGVPSSQQNLSPNDFFL